MEASRLLVQASLSLWGRPIPFINWGLERISKEKRSRYCPAIAQALGLLSSSALSSCATDRLSPRDGAEINRRVQS
jgi:hypothetical protein